MKLNTNEIFEKRKIKQDYLFSNNGKQNFENFKYEKFDVNKLSDALQYEKCNDKKVITKKEAFEDFEQFKILIEQCYVGYCVFGKKFFDNVFNKIEKQLNLIDSTIEPYKFAEIIFKALKNIKDYHFCVQYNNKQLRPFDRDQVEITYFNCEHKITKNKNDFYIVNNKNKQKIVKINNQNPSKFVDLCFMPNGKLQYAFFAFSTQNKAIKLNVTLENSEVVCVNLQPINYHEVLLPDTEKMIEIFADENMAYINVNRLYLCDVTDEQYKQLLTEIEKVKDYKNILIDVCNNGGGSDTIVREIMKCFGLEIKSYPINYIDLCARSNIENAEKKKAEVLSQYEKSLENRVNIKSINFGKINKEKDTGKLILIFQNRNSFSAAEEFNELFSNFKNLVFVGDNTSGMLCFGNINSYFLKNSSVKIKFGVSYFENPGRKFLEGKGVKPDIYFTKPYLKLEERMKFAKQIFKNLN